MILLFAQSLRSYNGGRDWICFKKWIIFGGLDILSITIRKKTGRSVGSISIIFNVMIMLIAGILFGWQYMFYSALSIFMSGKLTDSLYTQTA